MTDDKTEVGQKPEARADALYDSAYVAGLGRGFSLGLLNDSAGMTEAIEALRADGYLKVLKSKPEIGSGGEARDAAPDPLTKLRDERWAARTGKME